MLTVSKCKVPMNKSIKAILFSFLFAMSLFHANAAETLTIVRGQDFPPYHYMDENGVEQGFVIEIIKGTAKLLDIPISFKQYPWSRCISVMEKGNADAMMNLFKTGKRQIFMHYSSTVIAYETNTFFALKGMDISYSGDINDIIPYKIGTIRNYSYGAKFDSVVFPINYQLETEQELIKSLINKRCEVIIANKLTMRILLNKMGYEDKVTSLHPDISKGPLYIAFSKIKNHEALSKLFSKGLKQFKASEKYQKIIQKYSLH